MQTNHPINEVAQLEIFPLIRNKDKLSSIPAKKGN